MPVDLGVSQESAERIIRALVDGIISTRREVVIRHSLAVLQAERQNSGFGYILDDAERKLEAALSE